MVEIFCDVNTLMSQDQTQIKSPLSNLLQKINTICVLCIESLDAQSLLKNALEQMLELFGARRGSVFILDQKTNALILKVAVGMKVDEKKAMIKYMGQGSIVSRVAHLREPLLVEDFSKDGPFKNYKSRGSYRSQSFICSPLLIKDHLIGVLNIADKDSLKPFTQREFQLANFLCNQIALNYQRISMAHQLGKASEETNGLKKQIASQERLASLGKLAGGIAHDFNNPLDGVMRYNNLCLRHVQDDEVLREYLTEVQMGLKRMANIVKNLLSCARQSPRSNQKVDIHRAIEGALRELHPYFVAKNINLNKDFASGIPQIIDWGVELIVNNLAKNAIDATDRNGTITITTAYDGENIQIMLSDTGRGIPNENIDKIFEPFFTTKDIDQGCGLGLTVVHEIIKCYNGTIDVVSHLNQGTTFTVKLPVKQ